jgi:hypothetical protein
MSPPSKRLGACGGAEQPARGIAPHGRCAQLPGPLSGLAQCYNHLLAAYPDHRSSTCETPVGPLQCAQIVDQRQQSQPRASKTTVLLQAVAPRQRITWCKESEAITPILTRLHLGIGWQAYDFLGIRLTSQVHLLTEYLTPPDDPQIAAEPPRRGGCRRCPP